MHSHGGLLVHKGSKLALWNLCLMLKISFTGCLGLSPVISTQFTLEKYVAASNREKKSPKPLFLGLKLVQGRRCWYPLKARQQCLLWCAASLSICNRYSRLDDSSRNRAFWRGYENLIHSYGGLLEPRGSNLTPLKSTFNAEHFIRRLSWSILNGFGAIHSQNVYRSLKWRKCTKTPYFGGSRSSMLVP